MLNKIRYPLCAIFFLSSCVLLSGCALGAIAVDAVSQIGITKNDRASLLKQSMKDFHDALYWGRPEEAMAFVTSEGRKQLASQLTISSAQERIVESKVGIVDISDGGFDANVDVVTRFYKVPYYIITDSVEREKWRFVVGTGWKLETRDVLPPASKTGVS